MPANDPNPHSSDLPDGQGADPIADRAPDRTADKAANQTAEAPARILDAALREFAAHGLAGARTEAIAAAAGVNKALLYYYFDSKEKLYLAALEMIAGKIRDRSMAVFLRESSPGERVLRSALDH